MSNIKRKHFRMYPIPQVATTKQHSTTLAFNVFVWFVAIILDDQLDEVHALHDKALEHHALARLREHVADGELQRALDQRDERVRVGLQEVQKLHQNKNTVTSTSGFQKHIDSLQA